MKEISKYSRLAMYLEKLYDKLNHDFFEDSLERPVITVQSTVRAYGHYTLYDAWSIKGEGYRELNIGAGTLDRPIENVLATLLHEMCHQYNDVVLNVRSPPYNERHPQRPISLKPALSKSPLLVNVPSPLSV